MRTALTALALLSFLLAGCVVEPGRGYGERDHGDAGWNDAGRGEHYSEHGHWGQQSQWSR